MHVMTHEKSTPLHDLPPSAKLVYKVLECKSDLTQDQLATETRLPTRTVRHALNELQSSDLVEEDIYFADARQRIYSLNGAKSCK